MIDLLECQLVLRSRQRALIHQLREDQFAAEARRSRHGSGTQSSARVSADPSRSTARQLRRLQAALERVADGSYGICMQCGGRISATRLDEDPSTTLCASCKGEG
ncbi:MAG: TraR/DksA C4-type zinc finger protein [Pseudomonadota bacterium]